LTKEKNGERSYFKTQELYEEKKVLIREGATCRKGGMLGGENRRAGGKKRWEFEACKE